MSRFGAFVMPALLPALAIIVLLLPGIQSFSSFDTIIHYTGWFLLALNAVFSIRFHRAQPMFASIILALLFLFYTRFDTFFAPYRTTESLWLLFSAIPMLSFWLMVSPRKALLSGSSIAWSVGIILIGFAVWALAKFPLAGDHIARAISYRTISDIPLPSILATSPNLPLISVLGGLACMIIAAFIMQKDIHLISSWLSIYPAMILGIYFFAQTNLAILWFTAAAGSISISLLQHAHSMAFIDALTGIPNRRALEEKMRSLGSKYSIAMADVDHFKQFNDTHGHKTGDQILRKTAALLFHVGGGGKAYRYGGEEFVIIFPGKQARAAGQYCQRVRESIENSPFYFRTRKRLRNKTPAEKRPLKKPARALYITVSMGIAACEINSCKPEDILKTADKALYEAKRLGRNRVIIAHAKES